MSLASRLSALSKGTKAKQEKKKIRLLAETPPGEEKRESAPSVKILPASTPSPAKIQKYAAGVVAVIKKDLAKRKLDPGITTLLSGGVDSSVTEWISTGFPELDYAMGGGWPVGRISELFGPEAAGKSADVHMGILSTQKQGGLAEIFDFEHSLDESKMHQLGIDPERLIYHQPDCVEDAQDILSARLDSYIKSPPGCPVFIAFDSVAAMPTLVELESSARDSNVAAQARAVRKLLRVVTLRLARARVHLLFVNQEISNIGGYSPNPRFKPMTTPGGTGLKYYASIRLRNSRVETLKEGDRASGYVIQTETRKCKLNPPHRKVQWVLDFRYGPSTELTLFHTLQKARVIKGSEPEYSAPFLSSPFSRYGWVEILRENQTARQKAAEVAVEVVSGQPMEDGYVEEEE